MISAPESILIRLSVRDLRELAASVEGGRLQEITAMDMRPWAAQGEREALADELRELSAGHADAAALARTLRLLAAQRRQFEEVAPFELTWTGPEVRSSPGGGQRVAAPGGGQRVAAPGGGQRVAAPGGGQRVAAPGGGQRVAAPEGDNGWRPPEGDNGWRPPEGDNGWRPRAATRPPWRGTSSAGPSDLS